MICFILVLIDLLCKAFGLQFAQDAESLGPAAGLEILAETLIALAIKAIKINKKDVK